MMGLHETAAQKRRRNAPGRDHRPAQSTGRGKGERPPEEASGGRPESRGLTCPAQSSGHDDQFHKAVHDGRSPAIPAPDRPPPPAESTPPEDHPDVSVDGIKDLVAEVYR